MIRREPEVHLPLIVGCREAHADADAVAARAALAHAGFQSAPMSTTAIASLAVMRLRTLALALDEGLDRDDLVEMADSLERRLGLIQHTEEGAA